MRKTILVVEDNSDLQELLALQLRHARFQVATASDGLEALNKARALLPDLILLDLVLPELDGFAVCEHLRLDPRTAEIPIIMLTGLTSEITRFAGFESGADDYVTKPVSADLILSKIRRWLAKPRDAAEPGILRRRPARSLAR